MGSPVVLDGKDYLACCGSARFAAEMVSAGPFSNLQEAVNAARDIWFNKVDVNGWLEAFAAHPQIGEVPSDHRSGTTAQWSKGEQSMAMATANNSTVEELHQWNLRYKEKFRFVFLIFASGRSTPEILAEIKRRYQNRPIVEFEVAAQEQMKITEFRLSKLFTVDAIIASAAGAQHTTEFSKAGEERVSRIGSHLTVASETNVARPSPNFSRTRPPITTHVLDVARGAPATGVEVQLEMWNLNKQRPQFGGADSGGWTIVGSSTTDRDGRSGQLMNMVDGLNPGIYRISFNTGKYYPDGFFPFVSIVFEVRETQKWEHFHVPLLLSPFSFTTYRGS